jgi:hypothetical protein
VNAINLPLPQLQRLRDKETEFMISSTNLRRHGFDWAFWLPRERNFYTGGQKTGKKQLIRANAQSDKNADFRGKIKDG